MTVWINYPMVTFLVAVTTFSVPAKADCFDPYGGPCKSQGGGGGGGGGNNAAAVIGLGLGLIIEGLSNAPSSDSDRAYNERQRKLDAARRERAVAAERKGKLNNLQNQAAADKSLNPWSNKPVGKKITSQSDGRAPYADNSCVDIRVAGSGISWDSTKIFNKCSFPIQVLTCYYDKGERQKCDSFKQRFWGTSSTIAPSGSTDSVSSSKRPGFGVRYFVCNMSGVKNHGKLCLMPKT